MNIRKATNTDREQIQILVFDVLKEFALDTDRESIDKDLYDIDLHYTLSGGYFGVAEISGHIIATLGLLRLDDSNCELRKMYISKNERGKGFGRELLTFSLEKARDLGFRRVVLETATPLVQAIALYKKFGFREYQPPHLSCRCDQAFELLL